MPTTRNNHQKLVSVCVLALKGAEVFADPKDSTSAEQGQSKWFLAGDGLCHKTGFSFGSIACHLAPKSKSIFIISNLQQGKATHMLGVGWTSIFHTIDFHSSSWGPPCWVGSFPPLQALSPLSCRIRIPKSLNKQCLILHSRPFVRIHFPGSCSGRQRMPINSTLIISFSKW